MKTLLAAKADQCIQFHDCLIENKEKLLAEANPGTFWASGLSIYLTEHCSPQFWPGQNMLGVLLTELTQTLLMKEEEVNSVIENSESSGDEDEVTDDEENDEDTGDSEEMHNKMEDNNMEVAGQETTESQGIAINQELRESQKSAESLVCEVSHVRVLSEELLLRRTMTTRSATLMTVSAIHIPIDHQLLSTCVISSHFLPQNTVRKLERRI